MSLSVDANVDPETSLLGLAVFDLQEDISINQQSVSGTLHFVDDYTGFSSDSSLQSGNFLAINVAVSGVEDATVTISGVDSKAVTGTGIYVCRIADKDSQTITVVASKEGYTSVSETFDLSGLTCETA